MQDTGTSLFQAYYQPRPVSDADLALMRRINELHLEYPFAGARLLRDMLNCEGHKIGRKHVATLMGRMGIEAIYRKPNTNKQHSAHAVYPYLLLNMSIARSNHVWVSRRVSAWRLSNTLTIDFCTKAVQEAMNKCGKPEIFNTDQGCHNQ